MVEPIVRQRLDMALEAAVEQMQLLELGQMELVLLVVMAAMEQLLVLR